MIDSTIITVGTSTASEYPIARENVVADQRGKVTVSASLAPTSKARQLLIERAVFAHIQAVRTLGRSIVNTAEIAKALGLPLRDVAAVVDRLKTKGVKRAG